MELLKSKNEKLLLKIVWAIGVLAGSSYAYRDTIIQGGGVNIIVSMFNKFKRDADFT